MASIKIVMRKAARQDGTYPLVLKITKDRRQSIVTLDYTINEKDWDAKAQKVKRTHANHVRLNNYLDKMRMEAVEKSLEMETKKDLVSAKAIQRKVKPNSGDRFAKQGQMYIDNLKNAGKYNQYTADKPRVEHFKEFAGDIAFSDITPALLERFKTWLKTEYEVGDRTIVNHLVVVRSVFSQAIKDGAVDSKYYPFGRGKVKIKFPESVKIGLNAEEVERLETVDIPNKAHNHARNLWLLSFYTAGMRAGDLFALTWEDIRDGRLAYSMNKNTKTGSLKLSDKAMKVLEQYEGNKGLIFPELKKTDLNDKFKVQRTTAFATSRIDKFLRNHVAPAAEIDKKLTLHIARHTFGSLAGDSVPIPTLQKLFRHSNITTTVGYMQNFINKDTDEALDSVINKPKP